MIDEILPRLIGKSNLVSKIHTSIHDKGYPYFISPAELKEQCKQKITLSNINDVYIANYMYKNIDNRIDLVSETLYQGSFLLDVETEWEILSRKGYFHTSIKEPYHFVYLLVVGSMIVYTETENGDFYDKRVHSTQLVEIGRRNDPDQLILQQLYRLGN